MHYLNSFLAGKDIADVVTGTFCRWFLPEFPPEPDEREI
jgi:hypothetical protein